MKESEQFTAQVIQSIVDMPIGDGYEALIEINNTVIKTRQEQINNVQIEAQAHIKLLDDFTKSPFRPKGTV